MRTLRLSNRHGETATSLLRKSFSAESARLRERLLALALIADGMSGRVVAQRLGRHQRTLGEWVQRFNHHGVNGLQPAFRGHPGTLLTAEELGQLKPALMLSPQQIGLKHRIWSGRTVVAFVGHRFRKTISVSTGRRYLRRLGYRRPQPHKRLLKIVPKAADRAAQTAIAGDTPDFPAV
jgi:transposase